MAHPLVRRFLTVVVVLVLLTAMAVAADPVFGRPNTCPDLGQLLPLIAGYPPGR